MLKNFIIIFYSLNTKVSTGYYSKVVKPLLKEFDGKFSRAISVDSKNSGFGTGIIEIECFFLDKKKLKKFISELKKVTPKDIMFNNNLVSIMRTDYEKFGSECYVRPSREWVLSGLKGIKKLPSSKIK